MRRAFILCMFLCLNSTAGLCNTEFFPPLQPVDAQPTKDYTSNITSAADPFATPQNNDYSNISKIEQSLYGRNYADQNIASRLSRIEKSLFNSTYQNSPSSQRIDNIIMNFNQINQYPNISKNGLSKMEAKVLGQSYPLNSPQRRIERLEDQIFGAEQSGKLDSRYEALKVAIKNYGANNFYPPSVNTTQSGWKGFGGNFSNPFWNGGTITGFTPPITPYQTSYGYNNRYNPDYNQTYKSGYRQKYNQGYNSTRGCVGLGGYGSSGDIDSSSQSAFGDRFHQGFQNFSSGTGTGVTILD